MNDLKTVLKRYSSTINLMGSETKDDSSEGKERQKDNLRMELIKIRSKNLVFFWITVIMTIIVFLLPVYMVYQLMDDPSNLKLLFGVTGVTISGLLVFMHKLWKEKIATDIIIVLASTFNPDTVNTISAAIVKKYFGPEDIKI